MNYEHDLFKGLGKCPLIGSESGDFKPIGISRFDSGYGSTRYVYSLDGEIVSALQIMKPTKGIAFIANVRTHTAHRRKHYATMLLKAALRDFKQIKQSDELSDDGKAWAKHVDSLLKPTIEWEEINQQTTEGTPLAGYMYRAKVPNGWLVKEVQEVLIRNTRSGNPTNYSISSSITFVPDFEHLWVV